MTARLSSIIELSFVSKSNSFCTFWFLNGKIVQGNKYEVSSQSSCALIIRFVFGSWPEFGFVIIED